MMKIDTITGIIIESAIKIHRDLGPGLLESVYETVLAKVINHKGLIVEVQKPVSFFVKSDGMNRNMLFIDNYL